MRLETSQFHEVTQKPRLEGRVSVDRNGDVVVGGELRNVLQDYRLFYVARVRGKSGTLLWEYAGPRQAVIFTGTVSPSHAGQLVLLQQRVAARWRTIATPVLGARS